MTTELDNDLIELIEDEAPAPAPARPTWAIAVIDDDPAVHEGTRFALYDFTLHGQGLEILSAHSAAEGRALLARRPDIAVVLLDVVMETDAAGLDLVVFIRQELKNETVRIILRTGQPGQAPERRVIVDYDINDYKAKTELTADKLFTALTGALRSYQQIHRMAETRRGLEIIIDAASALFDLGSMQRLAEGVLTQVASLLDVECAGILVLREGGGGAALTVLAGSGCYGHLAAAGAGAALEAELHDLVQEALSSRCHDFLPERSVLYVETASGREVVVVLDSGRSLSDTDRTLVEVFCGRLSVAFDNVILYEQLQAANRMLEERVAQRTRELTSANERLALQSERLTRVNAFKNEVLGKVAHDLKNPLSVILGRAELLSKRVALTPLPLDSIRAQLDQIRISAERLNDMAGELLADARSDALDIVLRPEGTDLSRLVVEVADANWALAERKKQTLSVEAPRGHDADCDPERLREAVDNLVSNAIKYSPEGGFIEVAVSRRGERMVIEVRDNGPGLSPEDRSRLFGRFQRLSAQPTGGENSTGLGLSIAKRIVELHGGTLTAHSEGLGHGTTFTIALPLGGAQHAANA